MNDIRIWTSNVGNQAKQSGSVVRWASGEQDILAPAANVDMGMSIIEKHSRHSFQQSSVTQTPESLSISNFDYRVAGSDVPASTYFPISAILIRLCLRSSQCHLRTSLSQRPRTTSGGNVCSPSPQRPSSYQSSDQPRSGSETFPKETEAMLRPLWHRAVQTHGDCTL